MAVADGLPADVLARSHWAELTRADYEAAVSRVPKNLRWEFSTSPKRVQDMLHALLLNKSLAAQARAHGATAGSSFAGTSAESDQALANAELKRVESDANAYFDAHKADFAAKAREIYELDHERFRVPEEVRLSDIAVAIKGRGDDAALARAREARERVIAGTDFATVAREYSDDPTTRDKGGALPFVSPKGLAPAYAKAVFALSKVGEVSEPIKAPSAYHVVRLEERRPSRIQAFDEVRDAILQRLRTQYAADQRDLRIQSVYRDPELQINQAAIDALVNKVDPQAFELKGAPAPASSPSAPQSPTSAGSSAGSTAAPK
jgi:parvulin-like peptidyl-prolyl isomerase